MKNRNYTLAALLVGLLAATSCSNEILVTKSVAEPDNKITVTAMAGMPGNTPATKLNFDATSDNGLGVYWDNDDLFSVFSGTTDNNPDTFWPEGNIGEKCQSAAFAGTIKLDDATKYYAFYPELETTGGDENEMALTAVPLSVSGQDGKLKSEKMFMYSGESELKNHELLFKFQHLTAVLELTLEFTPDDVSDAQVEGLEPDQLGVQSRMAEEEAVTGIKFSCGGGIPHTGTANAITGDVTVAEAGYGEIALKDNAEIKLEASGNKFTTGKIYLHLLPAEELKDFIVKAKVGNDSYEGTISDATPIKKKKYYTATVSMRKIKVGDLQLESGKIIDPEDYTADVESANPAVGVVAYLYDGTEAEGRRVTLPDGTQATGLVLALGNADKTTWSANTEATEAETVYGAVGASVNAAENGYDLTKTIMDKEVSTEDWSTVYPAFDAVKNYSIKAPDGTSGWYLPSFGEWRDILGVHGLGKLPTENYVDNTTLSNYYYDDEDYHDGRLKHDFTDAEKAALGITSNYASSACYAVIAHLNTALQNAGVDNDKVTQFSNADYYWSSSENNASTAHYFGFEHGYTYRCGAMLVKQCDAYHYLYFGYSNKSSSYKVRPILAF